MQREIFLVNFNSIKVQLEHAYLLKFINRTSVFQFHKGTIRTQVYLAWNHANNISIP